MGAYLMKPELLLQYQIFGRVAVTFVKNGIYIHQNYLNEETTLIE
jgi:hypothetical protein